MSLDGYIDDASDVRLMLSGPEDLDQIDELRAGSDAILVGAGTIRADNPRLMLRSDARRHARVARGTTPNPVRVVLTSSGDLDPLARIFTSDGAATVVYSASQAVAEVAKRLGDLADVVDASDPLDLNTVLAHLASNGIKRLMVEGGSSVHTSFLTAGLADELRLAIAPFFVGDPTAPRFVGDGDYPWRPGAPAELTRVCQAGSNVVLTYALNARSGGTDEPDRLGQRGDDVSGADGGLCGR